MNKVFDIIECPYVLRNELRFKSRNIRAVRYGIKTDTFVGCRIWRYMPSELKESTSLNEFRSKKSWIPENCPRKLKELYSQIYSQRIGYLKICAHRYCYLCVFLSLSVYFAGFFFSLLLLLLCFLFIRVFSFNPHFNVDLN